MTLGNIAMAIQRFRRQVALESGPAAGFTLIELLIAIVVVGILASVAYPSYVQYTVKAKRAAAQSFMLELAGRQEQYMLDARGYAANKAAFNAATPADVAVNYTIDAIGDNTTTPPSFVVTATPVGGQLSRDTRCGTLTYNHAGSKTKSGSGTVAECW
jgi:type IV pilus assembly protein PilE